MENNKLNGNKEGLISIVVPVHNAEKYIADTISSVQAQSYDNWELILVEDGSSDGSLQILNTFQEKDDRIRVFQNENPGSAARARNKGLQESRGRFLAFLDADDIWSEDKLEKTLAFMKEKDAAFVFTGYEFGDENAKGSGKIVRVPETLSYEQALSRTIIFTSTVMFDFEKLSKDFVRMPEVKSEDTATWWQILRNGYVAYGLDESLVIYRRAGRSLSSNKVEAVRRIWNLLKMQPDLSLAKRLKCFLGWGFGAVARRI